MIHLTYKIIAKLVAISSTLVLKKMLNFYKHGLNKGGSIYDNILVALIGIDYAKLTQQECVLL